MIQLRGKYYTTFSFGIPRKLVRLIKMCLNETYRKKIRIGKHLSGAFPIQNALKQGDALSPLLFKFLYNMPSGSSKKIKRDWN
jgi:hypothetical protein